MLKVNGGRLATAAGCSTAAVVAMLLSAPAIAQDSEASAGIADIVVTARNQQETLQTIPLSVAAFDRSMVERYDISDLEDVAKRTPNFSYSSNLGVSGGVPVIRGVGAPRTGARASVGILIDGIDTGNGSGVNLQSFDVERIEVVRGPQSTQFGRGVLAGAVNYISRRPSWDRITGDFTGEVGNYGLYRVEGRVSAPLGDNFAFSIAGQQRGHDGFYDAADSGIRTGNTKAESLVGGLRARLGDRGEAFLRLSYNHDYFGHPSWHQVDTNTQTGPRPSQRWYVGKLMGDPSRLVHNADDFEDDYQNFKTKQYRAHLHLNYDFDMVSVASNTSYSKEYASQDSDTDFTANPPVINAGGTLLGTFRSMYDNEVESYSQELRLSSNNDGFFNWLIGGYYRHETLNQNEFDLEPTLELPGVVADEFNVLDRKTKTYGIFGSVTLRLSERLTFSQELRWSKDRIDETSIPSGSAPGTFGAGFQNWLPRSILEFQATPEHLLYASASKGNKPGGFNNSAGAGFSPVPDEYKFFDEESLWNYEIGFKTRWFDNKLTLNGAAYYIDWTDIQVSSSVDVDGLPVGLTRNGGKANAFGFEVDFRFQPLRAIEIYGGVGYSPIRLIDFEDNRVRNAGIPFKHRAQVAGSPDWTGNFGFMVTEPVSDTGEVFLQNDLLFRSTTYATEANLAETGTKMTMDVQVGYRGGPFRAAVFVNNLFNDETVQSARAFVNPSTYARSFIVQLPAKRQIGVRASYRF